MNKNGYTLVELLAVIIIIALLTTVAVISYSYFIRKANESAYDNYIDSMHEAAIMYFSKNTWNIPNINEKVYICTNNCPSNSFINMSDLGLSDIYNPKNDDDKCLNSYIEVEREDKSVISMKYHIYLKCNDYEKDKEFIN